MASKKDLAQQLADAEAKLAALKQDKQRVRDGHQRYVAEMQRSINALRADNAGMAQRERQRMHAEHQAEQHRLREKERAERKAHLADLENGVLHLRGASEYSTSKDEHGVYRLDVTFVLDAEEHRALEAQLRPEVPALPIAERVSRMISDQRLAACGIIPVRHLAGVR